MILQNFTLDDEKKNIIGISGNRMKQFLKRFAETHKSGKIYLPLNSASIVPDKFSTKTTDSGMG